jgi:hypothetical protein
MPRIFYLRFIVRNLGRHPLRTGLTVAGIVVAVLAFAILRTEHATGLGPHLGPERKPADGFDAGLGERLRFGVSTGSLTMPAAKCGAVAAGIPGMNRSPPHARLVSFTASPCQE